MIKVDTTTFFDRDLKKLKRKHYDMRALKNVLALIGANDTKTLKQKYNWHPLHGDKAGVFDVHVVNYQDWILLYTLIDSEHALILSTGSHDILKRNLNMLLP